MQLGNITHRVRYKHPIHSILDRHYDNIISNSQWNEVMHKQGSFLNETIQINGIRKHRYGIR